MKSRSAGIADGKTVRCFTAWTAKSNVDNRLEKPRRHVTHSQPIACTPRRLRRQCDSYKRRIDTTDHEGVHAARAFNEPQRVWLWVSTDAPFNRFRDVLLSCERRWLRLGGRANCIQNARQHNFAH